MSVWFQKLAKSNKWKGSSCLGDQDCFSRSVYKGRGADLAGLGSVCSNNHFLLIAIHTYAIGNNLWNSLMGSIINN